MLVPNAELAVVEIEKLRDYSLNPEHEVGRHKAIVFASSLGFTQRDALRLRALLHDAIKIKDFRPGKPNKYGEVFIVDFEAASREKTALIRSIWMIDTGENNPRLVSCYVI